MENTINENLLAGGNATYKAYSIDEFDFIVNQLIEDNKKSNPESSLIFRGQSNMDWNIVSSAYRYMHDNFPAINITNVILDYFKECVQEDMEELKKYDNGIMNLDNDDEVMCMLQHLGGKSIFIDFSKNSHVALYFACEKYDKAQDGVVFVMRNQGDTIFSRKDKVGIYKHIVLNENNPAYSRVRVQNSCFLRPQNDGIIYNDGNVIKIIIDKDYKSTILKSLEPDINHKVVYPDIFGYIGRQRANAHTDTLKSIVFRETAQLIKDGNVKRMGDVLTALNNLELLGELQNNDNLRIKCLKINALMCAEKFDEALIILSTIQEPYWAFRRLNDINAYRSEQFDPIEEYFVKDFEIAKCYMGKCEYEIAHDFYTTAHIVLGEIHENDKKKQDLKNEILKQQATSLAKQNKNNLNIALDLLSELRKNENSISDIASIYMIAEKWDEAIEMLRNGKDDYSLNLRANCYVELSNVGNKKIYLQKAIETYQKALDVLKTTRIQKDISEEYQPKTYEHDHHFKLAVAYEAMQDYEKAQKEYEIIMQWPYENEDAMHDLAYLLYKMDKKDYEKIIQQFFYAIRNSRIEKHPRNYNDIGRLLIEIYTQQIDIPSNKIKEILKNEIGKIRNAEIYSENVQFELNMIINHIFPDKSDKGDMKILLLTAERLFNIADLLNRKDAFANKNIGDIYYIKYSQSNDNERNRREYAEKALRRYILAHSYYLIENKRCEGIDIKISNLESYLKRDVLLVLE